MQALSQLSYGPFASRISSSERKLIQRAALINKNLSQKRYFIAADKISTAKLNIVVVVIKEYRVVIVDVFVIIEQGIIVGRVVESWQILVIVVIQLIFIVFDFWLNLWFNFARRNGGNHRCRVKTVAALRTDSRILIKVVKFGLTGLTTTFCSKFWVNHITFPERA
jgi:hypothetical protein